MEFFGSVLTVVGTALMLIAVFLWSEVLGVFALGVLGVLIGVGITMFRVDDL